MKHIFAYSFLEYWTDSKGKQNYQLYFVVVDNVYVANIDIYPRSHQLKLKFLKAISSVRIMTSLSDSDVFSSSSFPFLLSFKSPAILKE